MTAEKAHGRRILGAAMRQGFGPGPANVVRGSSRRITTMRARQNSIREYQSDQPSTEPSRPLSRLLLRKKGWWLRR